MKNYNNYKWIGLWILVLSVFACKDQTSTISEKKESGAISNESKKETVHTEGQEVMLSARQYEALQMKIDTLTKRSMSGYVEANGQLEVPPQNEAMITSVIGANIVSIEVIEGDKVAKGQTVAYLSHPNIIEKQTMYLNAFSNSQFLEKSFERQKKLYDAGVGSGANFQRAEAEYNASLALVNGFEAQLQQLNIPAAGVRKGTIYQRVALRSPIEGYVEKVSIKTGQYVDPQTDLMEIVDTHHVHADLMVFEKDVYKIAKGQKINFNVHAIPGKKLVAEIYSISKTFEQNPKALHVHAEIENKEGNLIPGMYIQGRIQTDAVMGIAFPESAISIDGEKAYVFSAVKEGEDWSFVPIEVVLGEKDGDWYGISFLEPNASTIKYAMNNAYYLMAEMKKGTAEHSH
ncbi:efflux RND transporter periplasmic adaptor subunit [Cellulophaga sp. E16_2]|uniref:Efflux transporter, RND family, MFP subunit n=1 Tax=Cellulophaga algicola (strain DSM 14237 / IC166 / ACAM 630) TaxID=688270 RepID=E6X8D6_CELAD|nr:MULTISPECIES: efflux RND transporter periplasmic adaptor subunit [Cellulophaga]ADV50792.1 efflux transporter, RND family, MFP subunit [Cellulophaga algicola DSM 14237]MBO0593177.1 efflux RND transporter periplasmic adaptor subunit [Cellulophaga sp. E16_2]